MCRAAPATAKNGSFLRILSAMGSVWLLALPSLSAWHLDLESVGIFYSWCVLQVPRPYVESIPWPKWAATLQDSWTAVISQRSFSQEKKCQLSWVWCHCDRVTGLLTRWILIPALVVSNGSDWGTIVRLWISVKNWNWNSACIPFVELNNTATTVSELHFTTVLSWFIYRLKTLAWAQHLHPYEFVEFVKSTRDSTNTVLTSFLQ